MKPGLILSLIMGIATVLAGCGGRVENDVTVINVIEGDAAPQPTADAAPVQPDAQTDAKVDALPETGTETGGDADADSTKPLLSIKTNHPGPGLFPLGEKNVMPDDMIFKSNADMEVKKVQVIFEGLLNGETHGKLWGANGTPLLKNIRLVNALNQEILMGPMEISPTDASGQDFFQVQVFTGSMTVKSGQDLSVAVLADVAESEDNPGDFTCRFYYLTLMPFEADAVKVVATGEYLPVDQIVPNEYSASKPFSIACPAQDAGSDADGGTDAQEDATDAGTDAQLDKHVLDIELSGFTPDTQILIGGEPAAQQFSVYDVCNNSGNPAWADEAIVDMSCYGGKAGDFNLVEVEVEGQPDKLSSSAFLANNDAHLTNPGKEVMFYAGQCVKVYVRGIVPKLYSHGSQYDADNPHVGDTPCLELMGFLKQSWFLNGKPADKKPNPMMLHNAKPIVVVQDPANSVLINGIEQEVHRFLISVQGAVPIGWKQAMLKSETSTGMQLCNFRVTEGTSLMSPTDYNVIDPITGTDLRTNCLSNQGGTDLLYAVSFPQERNLQGSGQVYAVRATPVFSGTGHYVKTWFYTLPHSGIGFVGSLLNAAYLQFVNSPSLFHLDRALGDGVPDAVGSFLWTAMEEVPHTDTSGGSPDYADDQYLADLTKYTLLSN